LGDKKNNSTRITWGAKFLNTSLHGTIPRIISVEDLGTLKKGRLQNS